MILALVLTIIFDHMFLFLQSTQRHVVRQPRKGSERTAFHTHYTNYSQHNEILLRINRRKPSL